MASLINSAGPLRERTKYVLTKNYEGRCFIVSNG